MLLVGVKENNGWLLSRWNLTYRVGWEQICKAVQSVYDYYSQVEILVGDALMDVETKDDVLNLEEAASLTIRGMSNIVKVPIMITFVNQTNVVDVNVAQMTEEFSEADYQKFNMSLCQYMDSIELAMHR
ncbi:MAG: hypothetical protein II994_00590 [Lachnospiraceae bacterium]|nr:hypothetical protein [Lachnospiraceae bacterium]